MMIANIVRGVRARQRSEDGFSMPIVIGVALILGMVFLSVQGVLLASVTSAASSAASLRTVAKAEAGRDVVLQALVSGTCVNQGEDDSYRWRVFKSAQESAPGAVTQAGVTLGCPTASDKFVIIETTAEHFNYERSVTSVYELQALQPGASVLPGAYNATTVNGLAGLEVRKAPGGVALPTVIARGDFNCTTADSLNGNLYVKDGRLGASEACGGIKGNVSVNGPIGFIAGSKELITGDLCAIGSNQAFNTANVAGSATFNQAQCSGLGLSTWIDYYPVETAENWSNDYCLNQASARIKSAGVGLVNAMGCGGVLNLSNQTITLQSDITILANGFNLDNTVIRSLDESKPKKLNLIVPDVQTIPRETPNCFPGQVTSSFNNTVMDGLVSGVIYSPCEVNATDINWVGQVYAGSSSGFTGVLKYQPVALPGLAASPSAPAAPVIPPKLVSHTESALVSTINP